MRRGTSLRGTLALSLTRCFSSGAAMSTLPPPLPSGDLDLQLDRAGTDARKLNGRRGAYVGRDVIPLWVADMDFCCPRPIVDAVVARARHPVYGYTDAPPRLGELTCARLRRVYSAPEACAPEWIRWQPGLIAGLNHAVRAACRAETDAVAIATPVYPPFLSAPSTCGVRLERVPLHESRDGARLRYEVDWGKMEAALALPHVRVLLWANPHNPTGRCWTTDDMRRLCELCVAHDVVLCSDEARMLLLLLYTWHATWCLLLLG